MRACGTFQPHSQLLLGSNSNTKKSDENAPALKWRLFSEKARLACSIPFRRHRGGIFYRSRVICIAVTDVTNIVLQMQGLNR
jgi:hypothetical protein